MAPSEQQKATCLENPNCLLKLTGEAVALLQVRGLLRHYVNLLGNQLGYTYAGVGLLEDEALVFRPHSTWGLPDEQLAVAGGRTRWTVPLQEGVVGRVASLGKPELVERIGTAEHSFLAGLTGIRSQICVPLLRDDRLLGVLDVRANRALGAVDLEFLELTGKLLASSLYAAQSHERQRRRAHQLRVVNEISRLASSSLDPSEVLLVACGAVEEMLGVALTAVLLVDADSGQISTGAQVTRTGASKLADITAWAATLPEDTKASLLRNRRTMRIDDSADHGVVEFLGQTTRSQLIVPVAHRGQVVGLIVLEDSEAGRFTDSDQKFAERLAASLAPAIRNARLFQRNRASLDLLLHVNEIVRAVTLTSDLQPMVESLCRETAKRLGFLSVGVFIPDEAHLVLRAMHSPDGAGDNGGTPVTPEVVLDPTVDRSETLRLGRRDAELSKQRLHPAARSLLRVPIVAADETVGAIQVESAGEHAFDDLQELAIKTLVKAISGPLGNAHGLIRSQQLREDLNHMVVHDLRNPLQMVRLTLQDMLIDNDLSAGGVKSVRSAVAQTENLLQMVGSLLDIARFEGGGVHLRPMPTVLNDHVRGVIKRLAPLAHQRRIQLMSVLSPDIPVMHLDRVLIERLIGNLVENALKHTPEGGEVTASVEVGPEDAPGSPLAGPCVILSVADNGDGIPPEYRDKVFEKFMRVEAHMAGMARSPGLGLTLCRYVAEAHGGKIWVEGAVPSGAMFKVALPLRRP